MKRIFDVVLSTVGIWVFSPVLLGLALAIKVVSRGPIFYRGSRVGKDGREFRIFKFRSMIENAESAGGSSTANGDPRVTPMGRFMRKYKLDELPQLFNVLVGDMSFVGPRPEVQEYVDMYTYEEQILLTLRPGITDWASIWNSDEGAVLSGSSDPDWAYLHLIRPTKLKLQLLYARNHSVWVDCKIICYTLLKLIREEWIPNELANYDRPLPATANRAAWSVPNSHCPIRSVRDDLRKPQQSVAILIPCRNERLHIVRCLDSLLANDYPHDLLEIVVIDGMSDDGTREIVKDYSQRYSFIRCLENPEKNKPAALNLGVRATNSDVVMRIDAHAVYAPDYVSKLVQGLELYQADNIGGVRENISQKTVWSRAVSIAISHPFTAGNAVYRTGVRGDEPREVDTVFCGCYPRRVFHEIGGFHPGLLRTQDREFNARLRANGGRIVLDPSVRCWYHPRTALIDYVPWVFQGAYWVFYADRFTNTRMRSWRNWIPGLFSAWSLFACVLLLVSSPLYAVAFLPLALYWLVAVACSLQESVRGRSWLLFPSLLVLFPATHYSYGLGSLFGRITCWLTPSSPLCAPVVPEPAKIRKAV